MKFQIDHDFHIHSKLSLCSGDAEQTPARILEYARASNLKSICLTDHYWDENVSGVSDWYKIQDFAHISQALPLPQSEDIHFFFGCETDMDKHMNIGISDKMLDTFDFIIIPTTHLHMTGFTVEEWQTSVKERADLYVKRLDKLLDMDLPFHKIGVAHLTCQLIAYNFGKDRDEHLKILDCIEDSTYRELFSKFAKCGAGLELNLSAIGYSTSEWERVLRPYKIAKEQGCKFYLGSDAHHPSELDGAMARFTEIVDLLELDEKDKFTFR